MEKNNIENKIEHNLHGIKKMIGIFYGDCDSDYKIDLFLKAKEQYFIRFEHHKKTYKKIEESQYEALQDIYSELHKFS